MSKELLVVVNEPSDASKVYPLPEVSILIPVNVATPPMALTGLVPDRFAPPVPVPDVIDNVTLAEYPVATFPNGSKAVTTMPVPGLIVALAFVVVGSDVNVSWLAAAAFTVTAAV